MDDDEVVVWICECAGRGCNRDVFMTLDERIRLDSMGYIRSLDCHFLDVNEMEVYRDEKCWIAQEIQC